MADQTKTKSWQWIVALVVLVLGAMYLSGHYRATPTTEQLVQDKALGAQVKGFAEALSNKGMLDDYLHSSYSKTTFTNPIARQYLDYGAMVEYLGVLTAEPMTADDGTKELSVTAQARYEKVGGVFLNLKMRKEEKGDQWMVSNFSPTYHTATEDSPFR